MVRTLQGRPGLARFPLAQQCVAQTIRSFRIARLPHRFRTELFFRLWPAGSKHEDLSKFEMQVRGIGSEFESFFELLLRFIGPTKHEEIFRHGLMGSS